MEYTLWFKTGVFTKSVVKSYFSCPTQSNCVVYGKVITLMS